MNIAYLILAHTDVEHIKRLCNKLTENNYSSVYVHVDKKVNIVPFKQALQQNRNVNFIDSRVSVYWGGFNSVIATLNLLKVAHESGNYDRFVLLQGLDYPLVSNQDIHNFFELNKDIEFIRACKITGSSEYYHSSKCSQFWFYDNPNIFKKAINKLNRIFRVKMRSDYVDDEKRYYVYWGSAQWALTNYAVSYILDFSSKHTKFNKYFKYIFPPDETYFQSIVYNSELANRTLFGGAEKTSKFLVNWRNLHYFEYDDEIKVFTIDDYKNLMGSKCIFFRKATTELSIELLNKLDAEHSAIREVI